MCLLCAWSVFGGIFWTCGVCVSVCVCVCVCVCVRAHCVGLRFICFWSGHFGVQIWQSYVRLCTACLTGIYTTETGWCRHECWNQCRQIATTSYVIVSVTANCNLSILLWLFVSNLKLCIRTNIFLILSLPPRYNLSTAKDMCIFILVFALPNIYLVLIHWRLCTVV